MEAHEEVEVEGEGGEWQAVATEERGGSKCGKRKK